MEPPFALQRSARRRAMTRWILLVALLALPIAAVQAETAKSGPTFVLLCESASGSVRAVCAGLIESVLEAEIMLRRKQPELQTVCPPRRLDASATIRVFVNWARLSPELEEMDYPQAVLAALRDAFPCEGEPRIKVR